MPKLSWFIVYKGGGSGGGFKTRLEQAGLDFFIPTIQKEKLSKDGKEIVSVEVPAINNLVFIRTDKDIHKLVDEIDCLRSPFMDFSTGKPAIVGEEEMNRFMAVVKSNQDNVMLLRAPYRKFTTHQKVRIRAGEFEGLEGHVVRILRDRKIVISLGTMAIAISGIHHSLLESIE